MKGFIFIIGILGVGYYLYRQNHTIQVSRYELKIPNTGDSLSGIKLIQLTDLHLPNGGASIEKILTHVKEEKPHLILLTGDLIHSGNQDFPSVELVHLAEELTSVAIVYAISGNHDVGSGDIEKWTTLLENTGIRVLKNESEWIPLGEEGFVLMGLSESEILRHSPGTILNKIELPLGKEHLPKVLLAHHPEYFEEYIVDVSKRPALTFTGHAHGGQVILPIVGGLFAPGQGILPKYDFGLYASESVPSSRMILSRGLGNSHFPFRINNRPEVVVVTFK